MTTSYDTDFKDRRMAIVWLVCVVDAHLQLFGCCKRLRKSQDIVFNDVCKYAHKKLLCKLFSLILYILAYRLISLSHAMRPALQSAIFGWQNYRISQILFQE